MVTNWPSPVGSSVNSCGNVRTACTFKVLTIFAGARIAVVDKR
jgi:hypothetical protein